MPGGKTTALIRRRLWLAGAAALAWAVASAELPHAPVPGGIARIFLPIPGSQPAPSAYFQNRRVLVRRDDAGWYALVGLPLDIPPGTYVLETENARLPFTVQAKDYPEQRLSIRNPRQVEPQAEDLRRIEQEQRLIRHALDHFSAHEPASLSLSFLPAEGPISSAFGLRRYFNGQPRRPHAGLDIAAPFGTAVKTPLAGRVLATGDFFFNGRSVLLDHGQSLVSLYCHLERIDVRPDDWLEAGQPLGTVGMSGRATGPHLHWGLALNGHWVDPMLLLPQRSGPERSGEENGTPLRSGHISSAAPVSKYPREHPDD